MVEGRSELVHLLLADSLGVAGQDLGLDLVDGSSDGGEQQLPADADVLQTKVWSRLRQREACRGGWMVPLRCVYLHGVVGVFVVEHQRLLDELVVSLQLVDVWLVGDDHVLQLLQLGHLVLQGAPHHHGATPNFL